MEDMHSERLRKERKRLLRQRKRAAIEFFKVFKKSKLHEGQFMPEGLDFCDSRPVKKILCQPSEVDVDVSSFDILLPQLPTILARWRADLCESLLSVLKNEMVPEPSLSAAQRLGLATTIFQCNKCSGYTPSLLFYPQVLDHQCFTPTYCAAELEHSIELDLDTDDEFTIRGRWSDHHLAMAPTHRKIAQRFVALAGLDPSIATVDDMDQLDLHFGCRICADDLIFKWSGLKLSSSERILPLWIWRAVVCTLQFVCFSHAHFD
jgi:hypothetical protein